jgi:aspartyl-tRNA(Asn)/glutamyl-tRNA(Gln) amidotransferase subunit C
MVSKDVVLKIARLARIRIQESELAGFQKKFSDVLESFNVLQEVNTEGVAPMFHAAEQMELREDVPEAALPTADLMRNAPDQFENCFRIPRVVGGEE